MKELGQYLKETRVNNGVSIDEAAQVLNIDGFLLESIEEGHTRAFKDVLSRKDKIKAYSQYLGLKPDEVMDEFNDFLFEKTSKISLEDILDADKIAGKKPEEKKVASPYTIVKPKKKDKRPIIYGIITFVIIILLILVIFEFVRPKRDKITRELKCREGDYYEFTQ